MGRTTERIDASAKADACESLNIDDLGAAPKADIWYRYRHLTGLWRANAIIAHNIFAYLDKLDTMYMAFLFFALVLLDLPSIVIMLSGQMCAGMLVRHVTQDSDLV